MLLLVRVDFQQSNTKEIDENGRNLSLCVCSGHLMN